MRRCAAAGWVRSVDRHAATGYERSLFVPSDESQKGESLERGPMTEGLAILLAVLAACAALAASAVGSPEP